MPTNEANQTNDATDEAAPPKKAPYVPPVKKLVYVKDEKGMIYPKDVFRDEDGKHMTLGTMLASREDIKEFLAATTGPGTEANRSEAEIEAIIDKYVDC